MEPKGSLLHSQEPATCLYQGNTHFKINSLVVTIMHGLKIINIIMTIKDIYLLLIYYV